MVSRAGILAEGSPVVKVLSKENIVSAHPGCLVQEKSGVGIEVTKNDGGIKTYIRLSSEAYVVPRLHGEDISEMSSLGEPGYICIESEKKGLSGDIVSIDDHGNVVSPGEGIAIKIIEGNLVKIIHLNSSTTPDKIGLFVNGIIEPLKYQGREVEVTMEDGKLKIYGLDVNFDTSTNTISSVSTELKLREMPFKLTNGEQPEFYQNHSFEEYRFTKGKWGFKRSEIVMETSTGVHTIKLSGKPLKGLTKYNLKELLKSRIMMDKSGNIITAGSHIIFGGSISKKGPVKLGSIELSYDRVNPQVSLTGIYNPIDSKIIPFTLGGEDVSSQITGFRSIFPESLYGTKYGRFPQVNIDDQWFLYSPETGIIHGEERSSVSSAMFVKSDGTLGSIVLKGSYEPRFKRALITFGTMAEYNIDEYRYYFGVDAYTGEIETISDNRGNEYLKDRTGNHYFWFYGKPGERELKKITDSGIIEELNALLDSKYNAVIKDTKQAANNVNSGE